MKEFSKIYESEDQEVDLAGKHSFHIFLDIVDEFDNQFAKQNYLNTSDYYYFFTSDKIDQNEDIIDRLSLKRSLETAYLTLKSVRKERLSFYFAIKKDKLEYGFFNDTKMLVYKVGMFKITQSYLRNMEHKCMKPLVKTLSKSNLANVAKLHLIREDFRGFWEQLESEPEILDERRIKKTFKSENFNEEDLDEYRMSKTLEQWATEFKWHRGFYYYCNITDNYVHLYVKIKEKEIKPLSEL